MNIYAMLIRLAIVIVTMTGLSTVNITGANAADEVQKDSTSQVDTQMPDVDAKKATAKKKVCVESPGTYTSTNGVTLLTTDMCINIKILKKAGCNVEAGKVERPAPPRDPQSKCKGKKEVDIVIDYTTACPPGWFGGSLDLSMKIRERLSMYGLSKSIATGRVDTWVRGHINLKDKFKIKVTNTCMLPPVIEIPDYCPNLDGHQPPGFPCTTPPPPPPTPTYSCDMLSVSKGDNRMATITGFSAPGSNGATLKSAVINWGDGSSETFTSPVGRTHTFGSYSSFTITATAVFDVNGVEKRVTSAGCQSVITFDKPDSPPSVNGQVPEHVIYGDDALWADFDATDIDGDAITFEYSYDGPINIQAIQEINTSTGKRLSIKFSAKYVAPGTTQDAHFYVTAVANGKRSSQFIGTVQVANLG